MGLIKFLKLLPVAKISGARSLGIQNTMIRDPIVTVEQGRLKGSILKLLDHSTYYSFKGIPYAEVPARFMAPKPPSPWQGTYDATKHGPICTQFDTMTRKIVEGDENCLSLNVYTKSLDQKSNLPVMVFIHGGAYTSGSSNSEAGFGPDFLIQHDVILVTINYRLEALGFLCLDTPEVPGNAGLKDQVSALRWVQSNIAQFGGDPNNVTIFGESAGGASVTYHIQSQISQGLFSKAIAQSGVSNLDWANSEGGRSRAFRAAKYLGCEETDISQVLEFLRSVPATKLCRLTLTTLTEDEKRRGLPVHFVPVVEKRFEGVQTFLTDKAINAFSLGRITKVPFLLGYNSNESLPFLHDILKKVEFINENPEYLVPREISVNVSEEMTKEMGQRIKDFYMGGEDFGKDDHQKIADMWSDIYFTYGIHRFADLYSNLSDTYFYKFNCDTEMNVVKKMLGYPNFKGASHVDDIFYIFYSLLNKQAYNKNPELKDVVFRITKMWTDFAKTGNPTPDNSLGVKWPLYNKSTRPYLDIDETLSVGADDTLSTKINFWNKLYCDAAGLPCVRTS